MVLAAPVCDQEAGESGGGGDTDSPVVLLATMIADGAESVQQLGLMVSIGRPDGSNLPGEGTRHGAPPPRGDRCHRRGGFVHRGRRCAQHGAVERVRPCPTARAGARRGPARAASLARSRPSSARWCSSGPAACSASSRRCAPTSRCSRASKPGTRLGVVGTASRWLVPASPRRPARASAGRAPPRERGRRSACSPRCSKGARAGRGHRAG